MLTLMDKADPLSPLEVLQLAVDICGSQAEFARRIERTTQAVWTWMNREKQPPVEACPFIEDAMKDVRIICETLRPDYKGWEILRQSYRFGAAHSDDSQAADDVKGEEAKVTV